MNIMEQKEKAYNLQLSGHHTEARDIYQEIVTEDTEDYEILIRYADCLDDGDHRKIPLYKKALRIGQTPWACLGLSQLFLNQEEMSLAYDYIKKAENICSKTGWGSCETTTKAIQNLKNKIKIAPEICIFVKVKNGLANRLRTINSFYNLALKQKAKFYVCWDKGQGWSDELFEDLFEKIDSINFIDSLTYDDLTKDIPELNKIICKNEENGNNYVFREPVGLIITKLKQSFCYYGDSCLEYMLPSFFNYDNKFFNILKPKKELLEKINQISETFDENTIGIHIRRGDAWTSPWKEYFQESKNEFFISAMNDELHKNINTNFFLSTDSIETNEIFDNLFKKKIIYNTHKNFFNSSNIYEHKPYQSDAVIDMFLLSRTKKIIGTNWSSFSTVSSQIGNKELDIIKNNKIKENQTKQGSVSLVCAVKNRPRALLVALSSWVSFKEISEFIIIDWSSDESLEFLSKLDSRIKVIRVDDQKYFHLSKAYNLAIHNSTSEWILKMDCDYILNPYYNFFNKYQINSNEFLTGSYQDGSLDTKMGFLEYLNGFVFVSKKNLCKINGYNENFDGYGYDDTDLYDRLVRNGLDRVYLNHNELSIFHLPHQDSKRYENYKCKNMTSSASNNEKISNEK